MNPRSESGWRTQFERIERSRRRLQQPVRGSGDGSLGYDDHVVHFFMDCWHLKDWIKNDETLASDLRDGILKDVHADPDLKIAQGLANGWKHRVSGGPDISEKSVTFDFGSGLVTVNHKFTTDTANPVPLPHLVAKSIAAWDVILRKHGLLSAEEGDSST